MRLITYTVGNELNTSMESNWFGSDPPFLYHFDISRLNVHYV